MNNSPPPMDMSQKEWDHLQEVVVEAKKAEDEFFKRHGFEYDSADNNGKAHPAHKAWVFAVEKEYGLMGKEKRVHLDTPIARKAFVLGWLMREERKRP